MEHLKLDALLLAFCIPSLVYLLNHSSHSLDALTNSQEEIPDGTEIRGLCGQLCLVRFIFGQTKPQFHRQPNSLPC